MDMDSEHIVLSRLLPKTGIDIVAVDFDDGYYQKGWWKGRSIATNRERFIAKTLSGGDVVIDRATGLMWVADGISEGCHFGETVDWANSVYSGRILTFAGFSDWRLPNIHELSSIIHFNRFNPAIDPLFTNTRYDTLYWSSTTLISIPTAAFYVDFANGGAYYIAKDVYAYMRCVRSL